ncbi:hypothetical protein T01_8562 [Trichinella spiralis]|uniref:Uncharacterized protein n=1 Tax=Trichinella spiralis TaxID=6334 RepID=A0A0V1BYF4_TRISP|nr:hypothetical protein T01_8562 [Trichinella spiralis]
MTLVCNDYGIYGGNFDSLNVRVCVISRKEQQLATNVDVRLLLISSLPARKMCLFPTVCKIYVYAVHYWHFEIILELLIAMHKLWKRVRESINQIKIKIVQICSAFVKCRNGLLVSGSVGSNGTTLAKRLHIS